MADDKKQQDPFFFEADVDVKNLKKSLSKAEKMYFDTAKVMGRLVDAIEKLADGHEHLADEAKESAEKQEEAQEKTVSVMRRTGRRIRKSLSRVRKGVKGVVGSFNSWKKLLIGGAIALGIKKMVGDFQSVDKVTRGLNTTLGGQPELYKTAAKFAEDYRGELYMSREDLIGITKQMGELRLGTLNAGKMSKQQFVGMAMDIRNLSQSMDVSTGAVGDLFDNFTRVYKLPHRSLRGIAASMKFIQEETSLSGDEILNFTKSLDDVLSRMTKTSKGAKATVTADMMAMAGAFKDMGIEPDKIAGLFGEALKIDSDKGNEWLAFLTRQTGMGVKQLRTMMEAGDVQTPMKLFIQQLKKDGPQALKMNEAFYTQMTGMSHGQLTRLMKADEGAIGDLIKRNRLAQKQAELHKKRAESRQNLLSKNWNKIKVIFENVWLKVGKTVAIVAGKLATLLVPAVEKVQRWLEKTSFWAGSSEGGNKIIEWAKTAGEFFKNELWPAVKSIGKALVWVAAKLGDVWKWWQGLSSTDKGMAAGLGAILVVASKLGFVFKMLGGKLTLIIAGLTALYAGAKKIANLVDTEQSKSIKRVQTRKSTNYAVSGALKGSKAEKIGFIRSELKSDTGLLQGKMDGTGYEVNMHELRKRAIMSTPDKGPAADKIRKAMVATWAAGLKQVVGSVDAAEVDAAEARHQKMFKGAAATEAPTTTKPISPAKVSIPKVAAPPAKLTARTSQASAPKVEVNAEDPKAQQILGEIRDVLVNMNIRGSGTPAHPSEGVYRKAIGG